MPEVTKIITPQLISSDKDSHFTGALAQHAIEVEDITGLKAGTGMIISCMLQSDQNLDWTVYLFATDGHTDTDLDLDYCIGVIEFVQADGIQIASANQYYYSTSNSSQPFRQFPYWDKDALDTPSGAYELHVGLVNRNTTAKNAGATGEVVVRIGYAPDEQIRNIDSI